VRITSGAAASERPLESAPAAAPKQTPAQAVPTLDGQPNSVGSSRAEAHNCKAKAPEGATKSVDRFCCDQVP